MSGGIYLIHDNNRLVEMTEQPYGTEDLLQKLLADYPNLLAGDQIDSNAPRRWLLVAREVSLASEEGGSGRWSVDHLFLDQDAIPTIVEVKRSSNTQIRREVVGQMLDYAANAVVHWPVERLQAEFEANPEYEQDISDLLEDPEADTEEFWQKVKINLKAGKVRLVFVSDEIPTELRRIVEFLNQQMDSAEVLAVEIKQYVSQDSNLKTLVPRIIGQTAKAQDSKPTGSRSGGQWDEESFFKELEAKAPGAVKPARAILEWAKNSVSRVTWGKGPKYGTFRAMLDHQGSAHIILEVWTDGNLYIQLGDPQASTLLGEESKRSELVLRLDEIPGVSLAAQAKKKWAYIKLTSLNEEAALKQFLEVLDWFVQEVKAT
ncbi:hypothetical protein BH24ACT18_BH24ACT18_21830 [soil metagenome]